MKDAHPVIRVIAHLLIFVLLASPAGWAITYISLSLVDNVKWFFYRKFDIVDTDIPVYILYSLLSLLALMGLYFSRRNGLSIALFFLLLIFYYPLMIVLCTEVLEIKFSPTRLYIPFTFFFLTVWLILILKNIGVRPLRSAEEK